MMSSANLDTSDIHQLLERSRAGDATARDVLARAVMARLEQMARQMLRGYPQVRASTETGDVLSGAMMRFLRAVGDTAVRDSQHFYALATQQIRRELLDLARRVQGLDQPTADVLDTAAADPTADLDSWCAFHEAVATLPDDERAVFEPVFYHDLPQRDLAEQLAVSAKTVQRRYRAACVRLYERLGGKLPPG
jgi:RNA polymerase sigma-70 factor (ECF subfamily)